MTTDDGDPGTLNERSFQAALATAKALGLPPEAVPELYAAIRRIERELNTTNPFSEVLGK